MDDDIMRISRFSIYHFLEKLLTVIMPLPSSHFRVDMVVLEAFDVPHGTGNSTNCAGFYRDGDGKAFVLLADLCEALLIWYPDILMYRNIDQRTDRDLKKSPKRMV